MLSSDAAIPKPPKQKQQQQKPTPTSIWPPRHTHSNSSSSSSTTRWRGWDLHWVFRAVVVAPVGAVVTPGDSCWASTLLQHPPQDKVECEFDSALPHGLCCVSLLLLLKLMSRCTMCPVANHSQCSSTYFCIRQSCDNLATGC